MLTGFLLWFIPTIVLYQAMATSVRAGWYVPVQRFFGWAFVLWVTMPLWIWWANG